MRWSALKRTKEVIIYHLRMYFANKSNYKHLLPPLIKDDHFTNLEIFDMEPEELRSFPCIIITGSGGDMVTAGLGDFAHEIYDEQTDELIAYRYGGIYDFNITIEVGCLSTLDREVLTDLVAKALRFNLRRKIESQGVLVKSMRYGGESAVAYDSNHIYVSSINLSTWSEWYEDVVLVPDTKVDIDVNNKN